MNNTSIEQNELISAIIFTFSAFLLMAVVLVLFFYFSRKKIVQKEIEKKILEIEHQKKLLHSVLKTQEDERKRIAQDLHDDISSKLNIISLNSHLLKTHGLKESELSEISTNIINLSTKALNNSRRLAHDLLPPVLEKFGLHEGVKELCLEFNSSKDVLVEYTNHAEFDIKQNHKHLHVFRILQELMNNSLRHGKATNISISFEKIDDIYCCKYSDNGIGFNINKLETQKGLGMKSIESRISFLNGSIKIDSVKEKGTQIVFNF